MTLPGSTGVVKNHEQQIQGLHQDLQRNTIDVDTFRRKSMQLAQRIEDPVNTLAPADKQRLLKELNANLASPSGSGSVASQGAGLNRKIGDFYASTNPQDVGMRKAIFSDKLQDKNSMISMLETQLPFGVAGQLNQPAGNWNTGTFQALFTAAWLEHPTEKGSYMVDLSSLSSSQRNEVKQAAADNLKKRKSSHLSGAGLSASKNFEVLKGYKELLVQVETNQGKPYLFLKAEGATTGIKGFIPHARGYISKVRTGEGLVSSSELRKLAQNEPGMIEPRAAENYSKAYGSVLKNLGLKGNRVSTQEMAKALFETTGHQPMGRVDAAAFVQQASNKELGQALNAYADAATQGKGTVLAGNGAKITDAMIGDLRQVAQSLIADGASQYPRIHREIVTTPQQLDASLILFKSNA